MEQHQSTKLTAASSSASAGSSSSSPRRSIHGSMSSAFLGVSSSSTHSQSTQRRSSPSLYPPPAPLPAGHLLASRGSAAASGGSGSGSSSSSQFHQISPSPGAAVARRPSRSSRLTRALPSPFLSELSAIRRMGANVLADLNAQAQQIRSHQQQEMTRSSSSSTMSSSQQQQAQPSFSSLQPLPGGGNFSGFPLPASSQPPQHMQPSSSSSTDLPSRIFSGFEPPAASQSQHFSTYLAPLPGGSTIFQTYSSCSADHAQPLSSDSELPPLPPSLEIRQCDDMPLLGQLSSTVDHQSRSAFVQPSETYELPPLPESLQMPPLLLQQVKQEPVGPRVEPEIISLTDGDELSAVVHSFAPSHGHGSAASGHDKVNNGGGSSSSSSIPWNGSRSEEKALEQLRNMLSRWSSTASSSSSSDRSMGSSVAGSWASMPEMAKKFDVMSIGGGGISSSSLCVQNPNLVPDVPKLILEGMDRPSSSMSRRGCTKERYISEADMERISKDNRLKELVKTDSKRVKRILRNRESVARLKLQKANQLKDLQRRAEELKTDCSSLSAQVQSYQEMVDKLTTENRAAQIKLEGLKNLDNLKQALNNQLQSELQRLKHGS